jgi:hypothetical protein
LQQQWQSGTFTVLATGGPLCHPLTGFCQKVLDVSEIHSFYVNIQHHMQPFYYHAN